MAYNAITKASTSGVICRNNSGFIMASCVYPHLHVADAFVAEALSCLQAMFCMISSIVHDIIEAAREFESVTYCFVRCEANNAAHILAREGRSLFSPRYWIEEALLGATTAAELDNEGLNLLL
ncbi:hypothetical protein V6N13_108008 [Hibiscus sabdariffa]